MKKWFLTWNVAVNKINIDVICIIRYICTPKLEAKSSKNKILFTYDVIETYILTAKIFNVYWKKLFLAWNLVLDKINVISIFFFSVSNFMYNYLQKYYNIFKSNFNYSSKKNFQKKKSIFVRKIIISETELIILEKGRQLNLI